MLIAAEYGQLELVQNLLERKASVNQQRTGGCTAVVAAIEGKHTKVLNLLLGAKADLTHSRADRTHASSPLCLAVAAGDIASAFELLKAGADPNALSISGFPPLFSSVLHGHVDLTRLLLDARADVQMAVEGKTALSIAEAHKNDEVIAVLYTAINRAARKQARRAKKKKSKKHAKKKQDRLPDADPDDTLPPNDDDILPPDDDDILPPDDDVPPPEDDAPPPPEDDVPPPEDDVPPPEDDALLLDDDDANLFFDDADLPFDDEAVSLPPVPVDEQPLVAE
jgi:ribosome-associated translation inhibitor RaiA